MCCRVTLVSSMEFCLALDVGGTKLAAGMVSEDGHLVGEVHVPTPHDVGREELFAATTALLDQLLARFGDAGHRSVVACGVGCGGPMVGHGDTVSPLNIPAWRGFPLRERLESHTGVPVAVDNDAKALALGEGWVGTASGCRDFLAMVVSTGIGGGIVLDGHLLDGSAGNAGHIGHLMVEPDGRLCACGAYGCLEAEASGTAIAAITGAPPSEASVTVIERTGRLVGRAVASVANLLDLPLALVGGSVALGYGAPFFAAANAEVQKRARLEFSASTQVLPVGLGSSAPLVGAGAVGWRGIDRLTDRSSASIR